MGAPPSGVGVCADLAALANGYAPQFKGEAKADIVKAILEEQYGKYASMNQTSNKLTSTQLQKIQELINAR